MITTRALARKEIRTIANITISIMLKHPNELDLLFVLKQGWLSI